MKNKILINDTIRIDHKHESDWLEWIKRIALPSMMKSGWFESYKITKILGDEGNDGVSYAVQSICRNNEAYEHFIKELDLKIQTEQMNRFKGQYGAFRTLLEIIEEG